MLSLLKEIDFSSVEVLDWMWVFTMEVSCHPRAVAQIDLTDYWIWLRNGDGLCPESSL